MLIAINLQTPAPDKVKRSCFLEPLARHSLEYMAVPILRKIRLVTKLPGFLQSTNLNPFSRAGVDPLQNIFFMLIFILSLLIFYFFVFTCTILSPYKVLPLHPAAVQLPFWLDEDNDDDDDGYDLDDDDGYDDDDDERPDKQDQAEQQSH